MLLISTDSQINSLGVPNHISFLDSFTTTTFHVNRERKIDNVLLTKERLQDSLIYGTYF